MCVINELPRSKLTGYPRQNNNEPNTSCLSRVEGNIKVVPAGPDRITNGAGSVNIETIS